MTSKEDILQLAHKLTQFDQDEKDLHYILDHLNKNTPGELYMELTVNGTVFSVADLAHVNTEKLFSDFGEFLVCYIQFLLQKNQGEQNKLLSTIQINNSPTLLSSNEERIIDLVTKMTSGEILNPYEIRDKLEDESIELSLIHKTLRKLVDSNILEITHYIQCYKCENQYNEYMSVLPSIIRCPNCHQEIVSIELHYRKR